VKAANARAVTIKVPMKFQPPDAKEQLAVKNFLDSVVAHPAGAFALLTVAAFLEAFGDSLFQSGIYRSAGSARGLFFVSGALVLALYGFTVNIPHWDFGRLLGVYVVLFFLVAQILAKVRFHQSPTMPIYLGGSLITTGGIIIAFWRT
jgi:small multidrug resistance family-3 protein